MEKYLPTVCYFPTTVLLVDDDRRYLDGLVQELDAKKADYKKFYEPQKVIDFFKAYRANPFSSRCILRQEEEQLEHRTLDIDVRAIHRESYNARRFAEVSVVVIDYAMPQMNGLDLCAAIKRQPVKKILLTGEADETLAVQAFNAGLIDKFVRKDLPNFKSVLNQVVHDLQKQYFHELSGTLVQALITDAKQPANFLGDKIFSDFFENLVAQLGATEFYLMDSEGSFMFLDIYGKPQWLALKNEEAMRALTQFTTYDQTPATVIQALRERRQIPYFHTDEELQTPAAQWQSFLHPAQILKGQDTYYYALIKDAKAYQIGKVLSFMEYCHLP